MTEGQALGTLNLTPSGFYPVGEQTIHVTVSNSHKGPLE